MHFGGGVKLTEVMGTFPVLSATMFALEFWVKLIEIMLSLTSGQNVKIVPCQSLLVFSLSTFYETNRVVVWFSFTSRKSPVQIGWVMQNIHKF